MKIRRSIAAVEEQLRCVGSPTRADGEKRYLKSDLEFIGVPVPQIRRLARVWVRSAPDLDRVELVRFVRALWRRRVHELRSFGIELLIFRVQLLAAADLVSIEWMLGRANTWAHVDSIAVKVVGSLLDGYPELEPDLDRWSVDANLWLRRSVLLAHLPSLRRGEGNWGRFTRYAEGMLLEREFFIRKAIGWVLREAGKETPQRVISFLEANVEQVSGLTLREAIRPLAGKSRERLLGAYRWYQSGKTDR